MAVEYCKNPEMPVPGKFPDSPFCGLSGILLDNKSDDGLLYAQCDVKQLLRQAQM